MEDDLTTRFENYKNVWQRVTQISDDARAGVIPTPEVHAPEYGSFCIMPDPNRKSRAMRFLPGL